MTDEQETDGEEAQALAANARAAAEAQYVGAQQRGGLLSAFGRSPTPDQIMRLECVKMAGENLVLAQSMYDFIMAGSNQPVNETMFNRPRDMPSVMTGAF